MASEEGGSRVTYADTAMKRDAVLQALPAHHEKAIATRDLNYHLGFDTRTHLEFLYGRRRVDRRQEHGHRGRWLWWRL